ncbi:replication protein A 70 kDa DNA-binding subunit B-like [Senna tora]|uniref:Replication protein A 70 kDa DNA-binding subunit B-like n=1 Tax=Senna tora TaxID=362788 RepID=A0A834W3D1_9FABA|nr:replication protein A 70 kDa DNA-binding subunit B-like [Senna tora]
MWKDDLHGIPSSFSVYDSVHHTWSAIQEPVIDVSLIYDRYIHISGILYWISATENAQTSNCKRSLIGFNIAESIWVIYDVSINIVGDQLFFREVDGVMGIITWSTGSLETTRHFTLFVRRNLSNGTTIFRRVKAVKDLPIWMNFLTYRNDNFVFHCDNLFKVDVNNGVCYKEVFIFPGGQLCDMNNKICASINGIFERRFKRLFNEGEVIILSLFDVAHNNGTFRMTNHKYRIIFQYRTKVVRSSDDVPIQYFGFDFVNLRFIRCGVVDSTLLIDVIGLVRNISNIRRKFSDNFQTNRIPIEIYDSCGNVLQVVLCGIHCENFRSFIHNFSGSRIIVAVQWCKVADFHGSKYLITSMEATRLLINEDITRFGNLPVEFKQLELKPDNFRNIHLSHVSSELSKEMFADIN